MQLPCPSVIVPKCYNRRVVQRLDPVDIMGGLDLLHDDLRVFIVVFVLEVVACVRIVVVFCLVQFGPFCEVYAVSGGVVA